MEFKAPTNKAEYEEMLKGMRKEISLDNLDAVVGGNDDKPHGSKKKKEGIPWDCPFCGAHITLYQFEDGPKHITKCPNNPYK